MSVAVGAYLRISHDPYEKAVGVDRQRTDADKVADLYGWTISNRYVDNDTSAYKRDVVRPAFEDMLDDLGKGKIQGIICYDLDRFARQPSDLERAIELYEKKAGLVFASVQGDINLQTSDGKTMARVMVTFANKSSMDTARRVARAHLENARKGVPVGSWRPFGWKADRATLEPAEAEAMRVVVDKVIAGAPVRSMLRELNQAGWRTTAGNEWGQAALKRYLRNPRLVGWRTYHGEVLLDEAGEPVQGLWEPLLYQETYDRLQAVLGGPTQRSGIRPGGRKYMLAGLVRCGVCSRAMPGRKRTGTDSHSYVCQEGGGHTNSISGPRLDRQMSELLLGITSDRDLGEHQPQAWSGEAELLATQDRLAELMQAFSAGRLSGAVVFPQVSKLEEKVRDMQNGRAQWLRETTGPPVRELTREMWQELSVDEKRAHLEKVFSAVLIKASRQRGFDPWRATPVPI